MRRYIATIMCCVALSNTAHAIEPISIAVTLLGAVISPIVCKEIKCKEDTVIVVEEAPTKERLNEMRNDFEWDEDFGTEESYNF